MRLGIDGKKIPESKQRGPLGTLEHAKKLGMEGVFFRTILDISPDLNESVIEEVKNKAEELNLYLESGLGVVNPYALPETPQIRDLGDGDTLLGFQKMINASAKFGMNELWISLAGIKRQYRGRFTTDRFRTDAPWEDQLNATESFLKKLAPIAKEHGVHLNIETHEEITTFEILRLIESVGEDVIGVVFDTGNIVIRGEHPVYAAKRVAPYVRQTHVKDAYLELVKSGAYFQQRPCGTGVVDFYEIFKELNKYNPNLNVTIECESPHQGIIMGEPHLIELYNEKWIAKHPDQTKEEFTAYLELAREYTQKINSGQVKSWEQKNSEHFEYPESLDDINFSKKHIKSVFERIGRKEGYTIGRV